MWLQLQDSETQEKLKMNITRTGMTQITLNYLKLCVILEPMQVLMSQSKSHNVSFFFSLNSLISTIYLIDIQANGFYAFIYVNSFGSALLDLYFINCRFHQENL